MKTASTNRKVRDLILAVKESRLLLRPDFQRRLVWSRNDKNHFLDSVLRGYPFPEIYLADGDVDLETGEGTQLLVDGLQRVSTLIQYFEASTELKLTTVPAYADLPKDDKVKFLQYDVAVRDLGPIGKEDIIETFHRLNATRYSLLEIEVNNALFAGELKRFCERTADHEFFRVHAVFNATDYKRMGDLRYALAIVGTMIQGYFNRDDAFESLLERYNDEFPAEEAIAQRLQRTFDFIDECGFADGSRVWKKADLFTLVIELDHCFQERGAQLQPARVVDSMDAFYESVEKSSLNQEQLSAIYYKAALQASNDKINRLRRGRIVSGVLHETAPPVILQALQQEGLS
ncbi:MAG: hypothetical protein RLZZ326_2815 [Planctomycetota bacterium]